MLMVKNKLQSSQGALQSPRTICVPMSNLVGPLGPRHSLGSNRWRWLLAICDIVLWFKTTVKKGCPSNTVSLLLRMRNICRSLIKMCHNEIHGEGVDPAKAFDELVKLFLDKLYDGQDVPDVYR